MADGKPEHVIGGELDFEDRVASAMRDNPELTEDFVRQLLRSKDETPAGDYRFGPDDASSA